MSNAIETPAPAPCPRCKGRGYITEDPMPDCPGVGYEEHECPTCEGSGKAMTPDDVGARLGYEPFDEYARKHGGLGARGSGRTTRMLCRAVAAAGAGERVRIIGHDRAYTESLIALARRMAVACGIEQALILSVGHRPEHADVGVELGKAPTMFRDHYAA